MLKCLDRYFLETILVICIGICGKLVSKFNLVLLTDD